MTDQPRTQPPAPINEQEYRQIADLSFDDIIPFVREQMLDRNLVVRTFSILQLLFLGYLLGVTIYQISNGASIGNTVGQIGFGFLATILLIPLHEGLHGLAYYLLGARKIHYTANFRKFYFTAQADRFVVGEKAFYGVAFTPFLVIGLLSIVVGFVWPVLWLPATTVLLVHTVFCGGDFALAGFFYRHHQQGMLTYDDVPAKHAYFYLPVDKSH